MAFTSFDEDKHFLMQIVLNAGVKVTDACKEVAQKMGPDVKPENFSNWDEIATMLGSEFTAHGCRQKFYKLKRESEALLAEGGNATTAPSTPSATKKQSTATPKASTGKGRKRKTADRGEGEGNSADDNVTPSKKARKEKQEKAVERDDEEDDDAGVEKMEGSGEEV